MATFSGSVRQSVLVFRKRRTRSASEQATRKYSCTKRSPCPMLVESSGYKTRVRASASRVSATAPTNSPWLNTWKSKKSGAPADLEGAVQLDFHLVVRASDLPGVRAAEPVVRLFVLPAVLDGLAEHAVLV